MLVQTFVYFLLNNKKKTAHKSVFRTVKAFLLYNRNVILSHI